MEVEGLFEAIINTYAHESFTVFRKATGMKAKSPFEWLQAIYGVRL